MANDLLEKIHNRIGNIRTDPMYKAGELALVSKYPALMQAYANKCDELFKGYELKADSLGRSSLFDLEGKPASPEVEKQFSKAESLFYVMVRPFEVAGNKNHFGQNNGMEDAEIMQKLKADNLAPRFAELSIPLNGEVKKDFDKLVKFPETSGEYKAEPQYVAAAIVIKNREDAKIQKDNSDLKVAEVTDLIKSGNLSPEQIASIKNAIEEAGKQKDPKQQER